MDIKFGFADTARELDIRVAGEQDNYLKQINEALANNSNVEIEEEKDKKYIVRTDRDVYVELVSSSQHQVGFAVVYNPGHLRHMNSSRPNFDHALQRLEANPVLRKVVHFAEEFGWWRVVAIPILTVLTVWVLVDIAVDKSSAESQSAQSAAPVQTSQEHAAGQDSAETGPDPAEVSAAVAAVTDALPAGGPYAEGGDGTFRPVGTPGQDVGEGREIIVRYSVEVENGIDTELIERNALERLVGTRFKSVDGAEEVLEVSGFPVRGRTLFCCEIFHEASALEPSVVRESIHRE